MRRKAILEESVARRLAVRASCSPKSIQKAAAGLEVRGLAGQRARSVLRAVGILPEPRPAQGQDIRS
jgi:hypothetical protein